jgi:hydrogenase nickel incorporation protein HypA/HybF
VSGAGAIGLAARADLEDTVERPGEWLELVEWIVHEMALAGGVVQLVEDAARTHGFARVRVVRLEIGRLAAVESEALRFCFEGAALEIALVPGTAWCLPCASSIELPGLGEACPLCGGFQLKVTGGNEMRVKDLEVE